MRNSREIFGAEIQYFRLDQEYWEPIILRLKETGVRTVTSYIPWEAHAFAPPDAKHPAGRLDLAGKTDPRRDLLKYLDLVEKHGMNLNFRCGPFCCNEMFYGGYPRWILMGDPAMMVWDHKDKPAPGYGLARQAGSQPSYLHPDYLAQVRAWFDALAPIIRRHLRARGGCITMINLDNEVSYIVRDSFLGSDYNPVNVRPGGFYHQFLAGKHGSAAGLPYGRKYACIEDVKPPRSVPAKIDRDLPYYLDWAEFKEWAMCQYVRRLRQMHEDNGVHDVTFMTNLNPHRPEGIPTRMPAFEQAAGGIVGYDFYRGTFMSYSGYHSMARVLKLMNASVKYTWSAEFMSGTWQKILTSRVSDDHMRFMARCALAHGCKAISWFMFHDRDQWNDAPVSSHGHVRPSRDVLAETIHLVAHGIRHWDALAPLCDVGIVYDLVAARHCHVGDPMPCADNDLHVGPPTVAGVQAGKAVAEYEGLFRLVEENGAQAGAIDVLHDPAPLSAYKLVFLPGSPVIETAASKALADHVRAGGTLVVTGSWPTLNELGRPIRFLDITRPRKTGSQTAVRLGRGKVIWHPAYVAQDEPEKEDLRSVAWMGRLLKAQGIRPHVRIRPTVPVSWVDGCKLHRQERNLGSAVLQQAHADPPGHPAGQAGVDQQADAETILFVLNHYPEAARFSVDFPRLKVAALEDLSTGLTHRPAKGAFTLDVDRKSCDIFRVIR